MVPIAHQFHTAANLSACAFIYAMVQMDLISQLASIAVAWYQYPVASVSSSGLEGLVQLSRTLASSEPGAGDAVAADRAAAWGVLLGLLEKATQADVDLVLTLAKKQQEALLQQQGAAAAEVEVAGLWAGAAGGLPATSKTLEDLRRKDGGGGSPTAGGSPTSRYATGAAVAGSGFRTAAAAAAGAAGGVAAGGGPGSPSGRGLMPGGSYSSLQQQRQQQQLHLRSRQLVLLQRALAQMHEVGVGSLNWDMQMRLLSILSASVEAAAQFNSDGGRARATAGGASEATAAAGAVAGGCGGNAVTSPSFSTGSSNHDLGSRLHEDSASSVGSSIVQKAVSTASSLSVTGLVDLRRASTYSSSQDVSGTFSPAAVISSGDGSIAFLSSKDGAGETVPEGDEELELEHGDEQGADAEAGPAAPKEDAEGGAREAVAREGSEVGEQQQQQQQPGESQETAVAIDATCAKDSDSAGASGAEAAAVPLAAAAAAGAAAAGSLQGAAAFGSLQEPGAGSSELAGPPTPAAATQAAAVAPPSPVALHLPAIKTHVSQSSAAVASPGARSGGSPRSVGSPRRKTGGPPLPQLVVSSVESREVVLPGLMRLEAEGGMLLIQVRGKATFMLLRFGLLCYASTCSDLV